MGGAKRANTYAKILAAPMIICHKNREKPNVVGEITAIGDVEGRNVIILDDMIDTAGTITKAADMLKEKGATSVRAIATHPVLSGPAYERIQNSALLEVVFTDSIPIKRGKEMGKIKIISVAEMLADIINKVYQCQSISSHFIA
jgi:ribose-phosphate pyrophosphokinase